MKEIYELKVGEQFHHDIEGNPNVVIWLRVPGGWLVTQFETDSRAVFIPYTTEGRK